MPMIFSPDKSYYEYQFITTFEETNVVGNIYFANYAVWQGKCREHFLYEYCPEIIEEINSGLALITLDLSIEYISQLFAFDKVIMKMYLEGKSSSRLLMRFEYLKLHHDGQRELVAKGSQSALAMRELNSKLTPVEYPDSVFRVFEEFNI